MTWCHTAQCIYPLHRSNRWQNLIFFYFIIIKYMLPLMTIKLVDDLRRRCSLWAGLRHASRSWWSSSLQFSLFLLLDSLSEDFGVGSLLLSVLFSPSLLEWESVTLSLQHHWGNESLDLRCLVLLMLLGCNKSLSRLYDHAYEFW